MVSLNSLSAKGVALALAVCAWNLSAAQDGQTQIQNGTVLGGGNTYLADGSLALQEGRVEDGIRLTLQGLKEVVSPREAAAAHSNLCGGYAMLREWELALPQCDAAIALDPANWRSFNNRAAVHAGQGQFDMALDDLRAGLVLQPKSDTLLRSLAVVEHNQKVLNKRHPSYMHS
jgi:tetratricopeptide (TPR) repeat protein